MNAIDLLIGTLISSSGVRDDLHLRVMLDTVEQLTVMWHLSDISNIKEGLQTGKKSREKFIVVHAVAELVEALHYKPEGRGLDTRRCQLIFSIYVILSGALGPRVYAASNRNESQERKKYFSVVERDRCVKLINSPPFMSRLCRQCGIRNMSQPHRPPRAVTGIDLFCFLADL
jgi:hypothetical protein